MVSNSCSFKVGVCQYLQASSECIWMLWSVPVSDLTVDQWQTVRISQLGLDENYSVFYCLLMSCVISDPLVQSITTVFSHGVLCGCSFSWDDDNLAANVTLAKLACDLEH